MREKSRAVKDAEGASSLKDLTAIIYRARARTESTARLRGQLFDHPKQFTVAGSELIARAILASFRNILGDTATCTRQNRGANRPWKTGHVIRA